MDLDFDMDRPSSFATDADNDPFRTAGHHFQLPTPTSPGFPTESILSHDHRTPMQLPQQSPGKLFAPIPTIDHHAIKPPPVVASALPESPISPSAKQHQYHQLPRTDRRSRSSSRTKGMSVLSPRCKSPAPPASRSQESKSPATRHTYPQPYLQPQQLQQSDFSLQQLEYDASQNPAFLQLNNGLGFSHSQQSPQIHQQLLGHSHHAVAAENNTRFQQPQQQQGGFDDDLSTIAAAILDGSLVPSRPETWHTTSNPMTNPTSSSTAFSYTPPPASQDATQPMAYEPTPIPKIPTLNPVPTATTKPPPTSRFSTTQPTRAPHPPRVPPPTFRPKTPKHTKPTRSLAHTILSQPPHEREMEGILRLDVFEVFRQGPASLLITMAPPPHPSSRHAAQQSHGGFAGGRGSPKSEEEGGTRSRHCDGSNGSLDGFALRKGGSTMDSNATLVNGGTGVTTRIRTSKRRATETTPGGDRRCGGGSVAAGAVSNGALVFSRMDSGTSSTSGNHAVVSPKRRRTASPSKVSTWTSGSATGMRELEGMGTTAPPVRVRPPIPAVAVAVPAKYVMPAGDGNDKVRPLPFPLIGQDLIDEYTECKDPGDLVTWKKTPISFSEDMEGYGKLAADEMDTCSILRVPPADYLQVKKILLSARKHFDTFTKRQAQKWYGIDVNKTGKIFDWFVSKNWLLVSNQKPKK
ncbi:hypothetical protein HDU98_002731 [Podochytrium sp. JEL0797]|nr:hypothetical protein HDU98_002731 [Podochytrium sp. JEL0797]